MKKLANTFTLRKGLASLGLAAVVALGATGAANAQTASSTTVPAKTATSAHPGKGHGLSALVAAGTITQAQADAIHAAFHAARPAAGTAKPVKPATPPTEAERAAHQAEHVAKAKAVLAPLVSNGTITQAQADAVIAAGTKGGRGHGGGHHGGGHHGGGHGGGKRAKA